MEKSEGKYAWTVTVGEKGQIVIPKQAREIFKIKSRRYTDDFGRRKQRVGYPAQKCICSICGHYF